MAAGVLDIFGAVVGLCFSTALAPEMADKHCYSNVYGGAHVRDVHVVTSKGKPVYEGETIYSATPNGIVFTYFNNQGGAGNGTASVKDGVMTYAMTMRGTDKGELKPFRGTWRVVGTGYATRDDDGEERLFARVP